MKLSHTPSAAELDAAVHEALRLSQSGRAPAAVRLLRDVLRHRPDNFDALHVLGAARVSGGRIEEGIRDLVRASEIKPEAPAVWVNLAAAFERAGLLGEAIAAYEKAAELVPDADEANHRLCLALSNAGRFDEALSRARSFVARRDTSDQAHLTLGLALSRLGRLQEADASLAAARKINPGNTLATINHAFVLGSLRRYEDAVPLLSAVVAARPNDWEALDKLIQAKRFIFDWDGLEGLERRLIAAVEREQVPAAVAMLSISDRPELLRRTATARSRAAMPRLPDPLCPTAVYGHDRIRLGYISGDFRDHPVAHSVAGLIEAHDRQSFEVTAVSLAPDDGSAIRARLAAGCDRFIDAAGQSTGEVARLMRDLEIDIAIDLSGITEFGAPDVLAHRPARVQVSYLGYPSTIGAPWFDYLIADRHVIPVEADKHFSEAVVRLPGCFFPPAKRPPIGRPANRAEHGLPGTELVFASFNNSFKLSPETFACWMRILAGVPGSVLWLRSSGEVADGRLRAAASAHGTAPDRLIFAKRVPEEADHLARLALADLFLDCRPYGAHSTASDALWAGLPVLTAPGRSFASRVAASMLEAVGVPELIARDLGDYEALAQSLGRDPDRLAGIRSRLADARDGGPLFNVDLYRKRIEAAYVVMHERASRGVKAGPIEAAELSA